MDGTIPDGHGVTYSGTSKWSPHMKFDISYIQGLPSDILQEISALVLEKKMWCKVVQPGTESLVSLADMCNQNYDKIYY